MNVKVPDDDIEIARRNTNASNRRAWLRTISGDGGEATRQQFNKIANRAVYQGQTPPQNIFNPAAWAEFIQAWKRGDFLRTKIKKRKTKIENCQPIFEAFPLLSYQTWLK